MANNQYKIDLGVGLNESQLKQVKNILENIENQKRDVVFNVDFKIGNADKLSNIGKEIETIKQSLKELNDVGSIGKGKGKSILSVDSESLKASINTIHKDIQKIQNAFGRVDKNKGTQSLLTTVNKIRVALEGVTKQFEGLNKSLTSLSGKDFNLNLDLGLGSSKKDPTQLMRELRVLEKEAREYENYIYKTLNKTNKIDEKDARNSIYDLANRVNQHSSKSYIRNLDEIMSGTGANSNKIAAYKEYIRVIKELAAVGTIDLTPVESKISESGDFVKLKNEANEAKTALKELFGSGINGEVLSKQLDDIVLSLTEIQKTLQGLSSGVSVVGLTQSFDRLSDTIEKLVQNATQVKSVLGDNISNAGMSNQAKAAQETANAYQNVAREAKKIDDISIDISDGNIDDLRSALKNLKVDDTSIENMINKLNEMNIVAKNVSGTLKNGELVKWNVKGIQSLDDGLERVATLITTIGKKGTTTSEQFSQSFDKMADAAQKIQSKLKDTGFDGFEQEVQRVKIAVESLDGSYDDLDASVRRLDAAMEAINSADQANDVKRLVTANEEYENALKQVYSQLKKNQQAEKLKTTKANLSSDMENWLKENTRATKQFGAEIRRLQASLDGLDADGVKRVGQQFNFLKKQAKSFGKTGLTVFDQLKAKIKEYSVYFSAAEMFMYAEQALRSMFEQVKLIDSAMTELKKVTNETDAAYEKFLTNAADRAKEIGTTIDGLVASTADFARLGYGFEDAQGLAEVANIYAVVGDEIEGVEGATESLISTMAAFKDEANGMSNTDFAMSIIDSFNELGNSFAISSGGLGEALERSASSLAAANNSLHESAALITAANEVTQNPEKVGNALKTISMRIRSAKSEMEELGEDTTGMVESTATLRAEIMALSGVDIMASSTEFKSTYDILDELSKKWKDLSDIQRATIIEKMAGKHQGNVFSSLMQNFDTAREALDTSMNSSGSAMKEHGKWSESLEANILPRHLEINVIEYI